MGGKKICRKARQTLTSFKFARKKSVTTALCDEEQQAGGRVRPCSALRQGLEPSHLPFPPTNRPISIEFTNAHSDVGKGDCVPFTGEAGPTCSHQLAKGWQESPDPYGQGIVATG